MPELPVWNAQGTEPPQSKKDTGWEVEERPPADYFNWFFNRTYECLKKILEDLLGAFNLKSAVYDSVSNKITLSFSGGRVSFLDQYISKDEAIYEINSPATGTNYHIFIRDNGSFTHNTTGAVIAGAVPIWKISTGVTLGDITTVDLRGELPGASGRAAMDAASVHFANKSNPHEVTYTQAGAAAAIHDHDNKYSQLGHGHDYSPTSHNHDDRYAQKTHAHPYAAVDHEHSQYALTAHTHVYRIPHTYAIPGEIKVPVADADFIMPFFVSLLTGQSARLVKARYRINSGTSVTAKLQKNGVNIAGFTGMSITPTATETDPVDVTLADNDMLQLVVTAVLGTPKNLTFTIFIEYEQ
jgi:hypothetical protein